MIQEPKNLEKWVERLVRYRRYQTKDPAYADIFMKNEDLLDFARQVARETLKYCVREKVDVLPFNYLVTGYSSRTHNRIVSNINQRAKDWMGK
jgi:hypothetical protein